jgi:hypothetical protein
MAPSLALGEWRIAAAHDGIALLLIQFCEFTHPGEEHREIAPRRLELALETGYAGVIGSYRCQMGVVEVLGKPGFERSMSAPEA